MAHRDWHNLARQVKERREALNMTQQDVAAAGGPSTAVQRQIENEQATSYRPSTFRTHEMALKLRSGSFRAALTGGQFVSEDEDWPQPQPKPEPRHEISMDGLPAEVREAFQNMVDAVRRSGRDRA